MTRWCSSEGGREMTTAVGVLAGWVRVAAAPGDGRVSVTLAVAIIAAAAMVMVVVGGRYGGGGRSVQVAVADGCARVRAYDGMRGKLGLGALQRGIGDSAMSERVARYRPIRDAIFNRQHTLSARPVLHAARCTSEGRAAPGACAPLQTIHARARSLVGDRNFYKLATLYQAAVSWPRSRLTLSSSPLPPY